MRVQFAITVRMTSGVTQLEPLTRHPAARCPSCGVVSRAHLRQMHHWESLGMRNYARSLTAAVALCVPVGAHAQRASSRIVTPPAPVHARDVAAGEFGPTRSARMHLADTSATAASQSSYAVAAGAIAGAILGGAYGYRLGGADCDGGGSQQQQCKRTTLIGGAAVGALIGAIFGHIIQLGNERDARRAARARADSASTPAPSHP